MDQIKNDLINGIIDLEGAKDGVLIEIKTQGSVFVEVKNIITIDWINDDLFSEILQSSNVEFRIYDLIIPNQVISINFPGYLNYNLRSF